jgi:hypothetical protein
VMWQLLLVQSSSWRKFIISFFFRTIPFPVATSNREFHRVIISVFRDRTYHDAACSSKPHDTIWNALNVCLGSYLITTSGEYRSSSTFISTDKLQ